MRCGVVWYSPNYCNHYICIFVIKLAQTRPHKHIQFVYGYGVVWCGLVWCGVVW